jgi:hypothetical protein
MSTPIAYKGTEDAAAAVGVSERTIRRALRNTDPSQYPPPLIPDGRHGERGPFAFKASTLTAWVEALARFDT